MGLIHTNEFVGANPLDDLAALREHAGQVEDAPAQWMPWNYTAVLPAGAERMRSRSVGSPSGRAPPAATQVLRGLERKRGLHACRRDTDLPAQVEAVRRRIGHWR
jgi:hypothetical protein